MNTLSKGKIGAMLEAPQEAAVETPEGYLARHPITLELKRLGMTDDQLQVLQFSPRRDELPFDLWPIRGPADDVPPLAINLFKAYCALKWLTLDNPPFSRDREDAWRCVGDVMI